MAFYITLYRSESLIVARFIYVVLYLSAVFLNIYISYCHVFIHILTVLSILALAIVSTISESSDRSGVMHNLLMYL